MHTFQKFFQQFLARRSFVLFFILSASFLVHANIFHNQFVMDDWDFIVDWPLIQDWKNLPQFFINYTPPAGQEGIYSPLKTFFHFISYQLFGLKPFGYHVVSLLIHSCGIFFVYRICEIITRRTAIAFLAALFFAVHPVQVEAITYITASVDMIGIVFLFAAFYYYIQNKYLASLFLSLLAVFTHELAISLPILFLWYDLCYRREDGFGVVIKKNIPFVGIVLGYVGIKYFILGGLTRGDYVSDSFYLTVLITIKAFAKYIVLLIAPMTLTHNQIISEGISAFDQTDFDSVAVASQSLLDFQVLLSLAIIFALGFLAFKNFRSRRLVCFCIGWFFISLLPVSNIIPSGVYFGERYLYPGMLGFSLMVGYYGYEMVTQKPFRIIGYVLIFGALLGFSFRTWERNKDWRNEITFYEKAVEFNPQSALMKTDLGLVYMRFGKFIEAENSFKEALLIKPDNPETYFSLSEVYMQQRKAEKVVEVLERALELDPEYAEAHYNLAGMFAYLKDNAKARYHFDRAIRIYQDTGRQAEAEEMAKSFNDYFKL